MKRSFLVWIFLLVASILALIRAALWFEKDTIATLISEKIKAAASNLSVIILDPSLDSINYTAKQFTVSSKQFYLPISIDNLKISPQLSALLSGKVRFLLSADTYGGSLNGAYSKSLFSGVETFTGNLERIQLGYHPQLKAFGIQGGILSANARDLLCKGGNCTKGAFSINLQELNANTMFIGKITDGSLIYRGHYSGEGLRVENVHSQSSLFNAEGEGTIPFSEQIKPAHPFYLNVKLTAEGKQRLQSHLKMFGNMDKSQDADKLSELDSFSLVWKGSLKKGSLKLKR